MSLKGKTIFDRIRELRLQFDWAGVTLLVVALVVLIASYLLIELTDEVREGDTQRFDEWVLRALRRLDDPAVPIGPAWLREAGMDATALGSPVVLLLVVGGVAGFMWLQGKPADAAMTVAASSAGSFFAVLLKYLVGRDRPVVVPHLREVTTPSFPSAHAMLSAVVFLTLGIYLLQTVESRWAKVYCLCCAMGLTFLVGVSRIYLGVHYPTDVLAGWIAGLVWALACWLAIRCLQWWRTTRGST